MIYKYFTKDLYDQRRCVVNPLDLDGKTLAIKITTDQHGGEAPTHSMLGIDRKDEIIYFLDEDIPATKSRKERGARSMKLKVVRKDVMYYIEIHVPLSGFRRMLKYTTADSAYGDKEKALEVAVQIASNFDPPLVVEAAP